MTQNDALESSISFADFPLAPPPSGVAPDFVHPHSQTYIIITIVTIFLALMVLPVILRIVNGPLVIKSLKWSDCSCFHPNICSMIDC